MRIIPLSLGINSLRGSRADNSSEKTPSAYTVPSKSNVENEYYILVTRCQAQAMDLWLV